MRFLFMDIRKELTAPEADRLRLLCNFTDDERKVFDLHIRNKSIVEISMELKMSTRTVDRRLKNIRLKVKKVLDHS